jgi:hypothetical protein
MGEEDEQKIWEWGCSAVKFPISTYTIPLRRALCFKGVKESLLKL